LSLSRPKGLKFLKSNVYVLKFYIFLQIYRSVKWAQLLKASSPILNFKSQSPKATTQAQKIHAQPTSNCNQQCKKIPSLALIWLTKGHWRAFFLGRTMTLIVSNAQVQFCSIAASEKVVLCKEKKCSTNDG
jgi:hypothetical protein